MKVTEYYELRVFNDDAEIYNAIFNTLEEAEKRLEKEKKDLAQQGAVDYCIVQYKNVKEGKL